MDTNLTVIVGAFCLVVVVIAFLFRGRIKAGFEGFGVKFSAEAEQAASVPESTSNPKPTGDAKGAGDHIEASGERAVAGKDFRGATVVTGDNNKSGKE